MAKYPTPALVIKTMILAVDNPKRLRPKKGTDPLIVPNEIPTKGVSVGANSAPKISSAGASIQMPKARAKPARREKRKKSQDGVVR